MSGAQNKRICLGCDYPRNIGYIEVILAIIFLKLPVNLLLEYRLVAKYWRDLIEEPYFAQQQFSSAPKDTKIVLYLGGHDPDNHETHETLYLMDRDGELNDFFTLPNVLLHSSLKFICSFNGLICCTRSVGEDENELDILILNPATRKVLVLPNGTPSLETPAIGVLFDPNGNIYRVARFFVDVDSKDGPNNSKCEIYRHDTGDWQIIPGVVEHPEGNYCCPLFPTFVSVERRIYWLVWSRENRGVPDSIHSLDMDGNFSRVELPETSADTEGSEDSEELEESWFSFVTEYAGRLAFVSVDEEVCLNVWLLENHDESSWDSKGGIELEINGAIACINSIVPFGKELLFIVKPDLDNFCFLFYDVERRTCRKFKCTEFTDEYEPVALPYVESLLSCRSEQ